MKEYVKLSLEKYDEIMALNERLTQKCDALMDREMETKRLLTKVIKEAEERSIENDYSSLFFDEKTIFGLAGIDYKEEMAYVKAARMREKEKKNECV